MCPVLHRRSILPRHQYPTRRIQQYILYCNYRSRSFPTSELMKKGLVLIFKNNRSNPDTIEDIPVVLMVI